MILTLLVVFLNLFVPLFSGVLLIRIILSYILSPANRFLEWLINLTEPILGPVRKLLPPAGGIDFAPLATLLLMQAIQVAANSLL